MFKVINKYKINAISDQKIIDTYNCYLHNLYTMDQAQPRKHDE